MRLGLIGLDNTHADHAIRHLNAERALGDVRVVALCGGTAERTAQLSGQGGVEFGVDRPEDLIGRIDAAIVMDRDPALHRPNAEPLLKAGIPVFVDKPLAGSVADAEAILAAARTGGVPVTSSSALRWAVEALRERLDGLGELRSVVATGPVQRDSPYGGVAFYGVHAVEMALHLFEPPSAAPLVSVLPGAVLATARAGAAHAVVNLVERDAEGAVPFTVQVTGTRGVLAEPMALGKDYTLPALRRFADMVETGKQPLDEAELLAPVRFMEAITRALPA
ncbi:Gfo/Idh/MocA family protein [Nonomuraea typhae]|uniref:Gfo/Idh/MocA family protein n=1 Tax=Nonomuraea typhae TaxID=2603600 RepID=UPI0012FC1127|nr:Gfo/Idh/MocA family oxidoreductase [Nonomuraea typhae]